MDATNDDATDPSITDFAYDPTQQDGGYPRYGVGIYDYVVAAQFVGACLKLHWILSRNMSWEKKWKKLRSRQTQAVLGTMFSLLFLDVKTIGAFVGPNMFVWNALQDGEPVSVLAPTEELGAQEWCYRFRAEDVTAACFGLFEEYYECEVNALEELEDSLEEGQSPGEYYCPKNYWGCQEFLPGGDGAELFDDCMSLPFGSLDRKSCMEDTVTQEVSSSTAAVNFFDNLYATNWMAKLAYGIGSAVDLVFASFIIYAKKQGEDFEFKPNQFIRLAMDGFSFGIFMSVTSITFENGCFESLTLDVMTLSEFIILQRVIAAMVALAGFLLIIGVKKPELREKGCFKFFLEYLILVFAVLQLVNAFILGGARIKKGLMNKQLKSFLNILSVGAMAYGVLMRGWLITQGEEE